MEFEEEINRRVARFTVVSFMMLLLSVGALHYLASSLKAQTPASSASR